MTMVRIEDILRDPTSYLRKVEAGETLIVTRDEQPVAEIKPPTRLLRPHGLCEGEFSVPDAFDDPLPGDFLSTFEDA